ncbi:MAG: hypothetical protein R2780_14430 [Crocinitomicaceae bacterium]|nr:hypothetical protein [Crocinitomicaceae bacterium]
MDLKQHLRGRNLKWNWDEIAGYCIKHPETVREIVDHCSDEEVIIQQNAGAVLGKLIDLNKHIIDPYADELINLLKVDLHDAVKRAILRVFQEADIPEETEGDLFEFVINALRSAESSIAIKAFGMTAARRVCEKYPELSNELIPLIEILVEQRASTGLVNRGEKELKKLNKLDSSTYQ